MDTEHWFVLRRRFTFHLMVFVSLSKVAGTDPNPAIRMVMDAGLRFCIFDRFAEMVGILSVIFSPASGDTGCGVFL